MSLLSFLGLGAPETADATRPRSDSDAETIRRIVRELEHLEPARARHIAAFAFMLSRVAYADSHISDEETREMERIVMTWGGLPEEQAVLVVEIARHQNILFGGTDNFLVSRDFKQSATDQEKEELLHCLFAVSAADDSISSHEEGVAAQVARELGIGHQEQVAIRARFRDKRAVMKGLPPSKPGA